jgi:hypothetical protein
MLHAMSSYAWVNKKQNELHLLLLLSLLFNRKNKNLLALLLILVWFLPWLYSVQANHVLLNNHFVHKALLFVSNR